MSFPCGALLGQRASSSGCNRPSKFTSPRRVLSLGMPTALRVVPSSHADLAPVNTISHSSASDCGSAPNVLPVAGLSELAGRYKALLLDQFGVLHDGRVPYPGAVEAVAAAAAAGLRLLIISNSSRRATGTLDKLQALGFDRKCFAGVVTSGELTHRYLTTRPDPWWAALGTRCLHINWVERGAASLEGYGLQVVTDPLLADFILAHGTEGLSLPYGGVSERPLEELRQMLVAAAEGANAGAAAADGAGGGAGNGTQRRPPPMVVANPDVVTVDGGELVAMPGTLASAYAAAGGHVVLLGKPAPLIYAAAAEALGLSAGELLAVGDSLEHDVAGAAAAGIDCLFIAGGIHARELLRPAASTSPAAEAVAVGRAEETVNFGELQRLLEGQDGAGVGRPLAAPTYVAPRFVW